MPTLSGYKSIYHSDVTDVDSSQIEVLGTISVDERSNQYVYLQGTASIVIRDWVVYDEDFTTTRLAPNEVGPVAIAPTAIVLGEFGWFQIYGIAQGNTDTVAADSSLYIDGTAGRVDDLGVTGDIVLNAYSMTAAVSNVATVNISYPSVSNDLGGASGPTFVDEETPGGAVNGSNTAFTLVSAPSPAASLVYSVNGQVQSSGGEDFTLSGSDITAVIAPPTGSILRAWYRT